MCALGCALRTAALFALVEIATCFLPTFVQQHARSVAARPACVMQPFPGSLRMQIKKNRRARLSSVKARPPPVEGDDDGFIWPDEHEDESSGDDWMNEDAWGEGPEDLVLEARMGLDEIPEEERTIQPRTGGPPVIIQPFKVDDLPMPVRNQCFRLLKHNMQGMYEESTWGWDDSSKLGDLNNPLSRFLIATQEGGSGLGGGDMVGFTMYRYELLQDAIEAPTYGALYVHELQLCDALQGQGVGTSLLRTLEGLAARRHMERVMLCVFQDINKRANAFYTAHGFAPVQSNSAVAAAPCTTEMCKAVPAGAARE